METLSSEATLLFRFGFPLCWGFFGGLTTGVAFASSRVDLHRGRWFYAVATVAVVWFLRQLFGPLKTVQIDGELLVISDGLRTIRIPAAQIAGIAANRWRTRRITIGFREPTEFGTAIVFLPRGLGLGFGGAVDRLRAFMATAR